MEKGFLKVAEKLHVIQSQRGKVLLLFVVVNGGGRVIDHPGKCSGVRVDNGTRCCLWVTDDDL